MSNGVNWQKCSNSVFWAEIAPCNHIIQIYENDDVFIHVLSIFVQEGFKLGECVIIIATADHLQALSACLEADSINIKLFIPEDQYIAVNVEYAMTKFMVKDWPDEILFSEFVDQLFNRKDRKRNQVRAFSEITSEVMKYGNLAATILAENLLNEYCNSENFCLLCTYPKRNFTENSTTSLENICETHSKIIKGVKKHIKEIEFANIKSMHQIHIIPHRLRNLALSEVEKKYRDI